MARKRLILAPLTAIAALGVVSPSLAAESNIGVADFDFTPATQTIAVGDTVTWTFNASNHSTTSLPGQPDRWDSTVQNIGAKFQKTFTKPGRYQYVCTPHKDFMKGVIEVGTDAVADSVESFRSKRTRNRVRLTVVLAEPAKVSYRLRGPSPRRVTRGRLPAGRHSFTVRRLRRGTYRGVLSVVDDFDKKITPRNFFVIR
jgi:plastocyanin